MSDPLYPLGGLGLQIKAHWKKYRPKMYAELEKAGKLQESLHAAQELTGEELYRLTVKEKLPHNQAWELVSQEWAFLPSEEDRPSLPFDPATLSDRLSTPPPETTASPIPTPSGRALPGRKPSAT